MKKEEFEAMLKEFLVEHMTVSLNKETLFDGCERIDVELRVDGELIDDDIVYM